MLPERVLSVRYLTLTVCLFVVTSGATETADAAEKKLEPGFVSIFDGKTFDGWEGNLKMFRVKDGAIVAGTQKERIPNNEFLCTKKRYGDFELRLQAKLEGKGTNAGIQFRSKRIPNHHEVIGFQADIGVMKGNELIWGALYDESRRRKFLVVGDQAELKKAVRTDGWNDFVIRCQGPHIQIKVNGYLAVDYVEKEADIADSGIIGVQIHSGEPAEASYRKIRIKELKSDSTK
jgi:hypothetical protein